MTMNSQPFYANDCIDTLASFFAEFDDASQIPKYSKNNATRIITGLLSNDVLTVSQFVSLTTKEIKQFFKNGKCRRMALAAHEALQGIPLRRKRKPRPIQESEKVSLSSNTDIKVLFNIPHGLDRRTTFALFRGGITTVSKFMELTEESILKIRNLGPKSVDDILHTQKYIIVI